MNRGMIKTVRSTINFPNIQGAAHPTRGEGDTMKQENYMIIPEWLEKIMGYRERSIAYHCTAHTSNFDEEYPNNRLPDAQQHIRSDIGCFTIDGKKRIIIG